MPVISIATAADLRRTLGAPFTAEEWLSPPLRAEPALRAALAALFDGLADLDPADEDRASAHLRGAAGPLAQIDALRCQLVAVQGPALTRYVTAPRTCLFQVGAGPVHLLGADCDAAVAAVVAGGPFRWWGAPALVAAAFAETPPWCPRCVAVAAGEA